MANVLMQAQPSQYGQAFSTQDGTAYTIGPTGLISIPSTFIQNGLAAGFNIVPGTTAKVTTNTTVGAQTAASGDLTGATDVTVIYTGINGQTLTTRTAAQMYVDQGSPPAGLAINTRIVVPPTCTEGIVIAPGVGVTWIGKQTIPAASQLDLVITFVSATAVTITVASQP